MECKFPFTFPEIYIYPTPQKFFYPDATIVTQETGYPQGARNFCTFYPQPVFLKIDTPTGRQK